MNKVLAELDAEVRQAVATAAHRMTREAANVRVMTMPGIEWSLRRRAVEDAFDAMKHLGAVLEVWFEANERKDAPQIAL